MPRHSTKSRSSWVAGLPLLTLVACVTPDQPELSDISEEMIGDNGIQLNGIQLNGIQLNGIQLNGIQLNGIQLNGIQLNGTRLGGDLGATWVEGAQLAGATLVGKLSSGATLSMRIDSVSSLPAPNQDVLAYVISYQNGNSGGWSSLCGEHQGTPRAAIPLAGQWNLGQGVAGGGAWSPSDDTFTFACRGAALAKCVELGYKPWASRDGVSLRDHHQACTRMVRADYCGDGRPGTYDGWRLDVFDDLGVQAPTSGLSWAFEARWAADGAVCMTSARAIDLVAGSGPPACIAKRTSASCLDADFSGGALVANYFDPWGVNAALAQTSARYPDARKELEDALKELEDAVGHLAKSPPKPRDAADRTAKAVAKLESAVSKGLPQAFGRDLMRRYGLLSRSSLVNEIAKFEALTPTSSKLACAREDLADGDALLAAQELHDAAKAFKDGIGCF